jgi:AraC-like DNA-binding protein
MYLIGPTYYFFILYISQPKFKIRWMHLLHLLPFILHLIELSPFYMLSCSEKASVYLAYRNSELLDYSWGIIPYRSHSVLKAGLVFMYTIAGFIKIRPLFLEGKRTSNASKRVVLLFLMLDVSLKLLTFGTIFLSYLFAKVFPKGFYYVGDSIFFIDVTVCAFFLLLYPYLPKKSQLLVRGKYVGKQPVRDMMGEKATNLPQGMEEENESQEFKEELYQIFDEHYSNPNLNNPQIAKLMCVSERQFYRKMQTVAAESPSELLLFYRLEKAFALIQSDPERSIGQISKAVGLNSHSYFTRRFNEYFGEKPGDVRKEAKRKAAGNA